MECACTETQSIDVFVSTPTPVTEMFHTILDLVEETEDEESSDEESVGGILCDSLVVPICVLGPQRKGSLFCLQCVTVESSYSVHRGSSSGQSGALSALRAFNGPPGSDLATRGEVIKRKIRAVGRLCRMYTTLREENESVVLLKGLAGGQIPQGLLAEGPAGIRRGWFLFPAAKNVGGGEGLMFVVDWALGLSGAHRCHLLSTCSPIPTWIHPTALVDFQRVKELDQVNERMPPPPGSESEGPVLPGSLIRGGSSSRLR